MTGADGPRQSRENVIKAEGFLADFGVKMQSNA
jgi:hypothetical protein